MTQKNIYLFVLLLCCLMALLTGFIPALISGLIIVILNKLFCSLYLMIKNPALNIVN